MSQNYLCKDQAERCVLKFLLLIDAVEELCFQIVCLGYRAVMLVLGLGLGP